eukprot:scaffold4097_cov166-Amphora_coffeaeformis.AAC.41
MEGENLAGHHREVDETGVIPPEHGDGVFLEHRERTEKENVTLRERPAAPPPASPERAAEPKNEAEGNKPESPDRDPGGEDVTTEHKDADALAQEEIVKNTVPSTELEIALTKILERKQILIDRITGEITKMKNFVKKRKQTYKRKRKEDGAPTRALSAYNMFIKERFAELSKQNEEALKSDDVNASLKRVPPSSLVSKTGNEWKELPEEIKQQYEEK